MDHELSRLVLAVVLTGALFFAWNYYRAAFYEKSLKPSTIVQQTKKVEPQIKNVRKDLSKYRNCGSFKIVVYPMYKALEYINRKIKNPGMALILFTLILRLLLAPLMIRQVSSSRKMDGLKDEIEKIKSRYKKNPLEIQKAADRLYKENGINPLGSVGMAIIQLPLFFALYKIVREASIFSGASLGLWINDLGAADPYFILPCLAGFMMFLGTRFTGNAGTQAPGWLIYLFPIMLTFFLLSQPAGLVLYILIGSVFQLAVNIASGRIVNRKVKQV